MKNKVPKSIDTTYLWPDRVNLNQACQLIAEFYLQHHKGKKVPQGIYDIMTDSKRKAS